MNDKQVSRKLHQRVGTNNNNNMITLLEAEKVIKEMKKDPARKSFTTQEFATFYNRCYNASYLEMLHDEGSTTMAHLRIGSFLKAHVGNRLDVEFVKKQMGEGLHGKPSRNAKWVIISRKEK